MKLSEIPDGYTEIIQMFKCGLNGEKEKVRGYAEKYISRYPDAVYAKAFRAILNNRPRNLALMNDPDQSIIGD